MIYHVYANRQNIGDWLAARAIQSTLVPRPITQLLLDEYFVADTVRRLQSATSRDLIIVGGGGLLMDYFLPFWEQLEIVSQRIPIVIWGIGYCDFKDSNVRPPKQLIQKIFSRARLCVLRDELTRSDFAELSLPPATLCPSLMLLERHVHKTPSLVHGVHWGVTGEDRYQRMCTLVKAHCEDTKLHYVELNNEIRADDENQFRSQLQLYADAQFVVSTRLHGVIIGLAGGAKVLAVSGDRKVEAFMEQIGLSDWVCELNRLDDLPEMMARLDRQGNVAEPFLARARDANQDIGRQVRHIADELTPLEVLA